MARYLFGASPADYTVDAVTGAPDPGVNFQVFDGVAGTAVTDLKTATSSLVEGSVVTSVTSNGSGAFPFFGPDGYRDTLWFQNGSTWYGINPTALGDQVAAIVTTVGTNATAITTTNTTVATQATDISHRVPFIDNADPFRIGRGTVLPTTGQQVGDVFIKY